MDIGMRKRFYPGEPVNEFLADDYNEIARKIEARRDLDIVPPLVRYASSPDVIGISWAEGFYAKLSGSSSPYSFTEQYGTATGAWADGVRTGTANAYEVNGASLLANKIVWLEPGYPGDYRFQYLGFGSGCSDATITAVAKCGGTGSNLTSVTFDLRDAADTTTLATASGSSATFTGLDGSLSYKVRVTKTGYHTKTSGTITPGCGGSSSVTVSTWPETYTVALTVNLFDGVHSCPVSGATVQYTGDASDIGVTDSAGQITFTFNSTSTSVNQNLNVSITPPGGRGAAVLTDSIVVNACTGATYTRNLVPSTGHVAVICNTRYMPEDMTWTDDYGSCTISYTGVEWQGSYTYTSSHCIDYRECTTGGGFGCYSESSADITVAVGFAPDGSTWTNCASGYSYIGGRDIDISAKPDCSGTDHCQILSDNAKDNPFSTCGSPLAGGFSESGITVSCATSSVSISFTIPPASLSYPTIFDVCPVDESGADVTITGTIT